ncbi:MAG: hypothetical protein BGN92_10460 [Sphingobacteriales bacterium 41-5]|nr:MAG: hypothetical protein ABS67_00735 [Niabella sp. SCN 42-15]OJU26454.1 MAG: hypothetical protein BGN92_10460 [Sphingobacteriales bacterium 41-5]
MKTIIFLTIALWLNSCIVYDPPQKGKEIRVVNQTGNGLYFFVDSFGLKEDRFDVFGTSNLNGKLHITNKLKYVHGFSNNEFFISDDELNYFDKKLGSDIQFYFIKDSNILKRFSEISGRGEIKRFWLKRDSLRYPSLSENSLNILFVYPDSIYFSREYNQSPWSK